MRDPDDSGASSANRQGRATRTALRLASRSPLAALATAIEARGLKHSRQRNVIVETFFAMGGHVPVDALVARVREQDPRVSVATVYRTMKLLSECGLAVPRKFGDGQTRYEPATQRHGHGHDHLICTDCGAIVEFESELVDEAQARVARRHGFEIAERRLEIYGRCSSCRRPSDRKETSA
ncbi:MAG TPA: transcriptional repressor [Anaeromyxobacteraceae bacterium]|nr:transcriptional repressor [Anaeromyxobacteraceae bacterium]